MGVSAILPTSTTSVPKIVSLSSRALCSGPVDLDLLKSHTLLGYQFPLQHLRFTLRLFSLFKAFKELPTSLKVPCVGFGYPFHEIRLASLKNLFQFLTLLGFCSSEPCSWFHVHLAFARYIAHALHMKTFSASTLCFSAFGEPSRVLCNLRV